MVSCLVYIKTHLLHRKDHLSSEGGFCYLSHADLTPFESNNLSCFYAGEGLLAARTSPDFRPTPLGYYP